MGGTRRGDRGPEVEGESDDSLRRTLSVVAVKVNGEDSTRCRSGSGPQDLLRRRVQKSPLNSSASGHDPDISHRQPTGPRTCD